MAIFVDDLIDWGAPGWRAGAWCHMVSDVSFDELHAMARALGIPRAAFQRDHYDLRPGARARAVALGAIEVHRREILLRACGPRGERARARAARVLHEDEVRHRSGVQARPRR